MPERQFVPPLHIWTPPRVATSGPEVADFMTLIGREPDPEQRLALDTLLSERAGGKWAALNVGICEPRQNGKTGAVLLPAAMADLWMFGCQLVVWTAHEMKTAQKTFEDLRRLIAGSSDLSRRVKRIWEGNGNQAVELQSGARMEFHARSGGSGRGFSGDSVTFDEAQALQPSHLGALMPTLSTRPNPQVRYGGSAGDASAIVWADLARAGRAGGSETMAWIEWGAERLPCASGTCTHRYGTVGCQLDNRRLWLQANHSAGDRIPEQFIAGERENMPPDEFARERMGWWEEPAGESPITTSMWNLGADPTSVADGKPCFAVDCSPRLKSTAIVAATWRPDGRPHIEVIEHRDGADWAPARVRELTRRHHAHVMMARSSPAAALLPDLMKLKVIPEMLSDAQIGGGCSQLEADFRTSPTGVVHTGDQILVRALQGASSKPAGDGGWTWQRKTSAADICPMVAATMSVIGLRTLVRQRGSVDLMKSFG